MATPLTLLDALLRGTLLALLLLMAAVLGPLYKLLKKLIPDNLQLIFVPFLEGERTPNLPDATGSLHGMTLGSLTRENLARAAAEGVVCALVDALGCLEDATAPASRVLLTGGAAASPAVQAVAAALFPVSVAMPSPGEYVALGAARQAAWVTAGTVDPPVWELVVRELPPSEAHPEVVDAYRAVRPWS